MALKDYEELDEADFYGQSFDETLGVVSLWVSSTDLDGFPEQLDILQDWCGVGYYSVDDAEMIMDESDVQPVAALVERLSYSASFKVAAVAVAAKAGSKQARWVVAQYDFAYDPSATKRRPAPAPLFLGVFPYVADEP